jgi:hypothetical protein
MLIAAWVAYSTFPTVAGAGSAATCARFSPGILLAVVRAILQPQQQLQYDLASWLQTNQCPVHARYSEPGRTGCRGSYPEGVCRDSQPLSSEA